MNHVKTLLSRKPVVTGLVIVLALLLIGTASILMAEKDPGKASGKGYLGVNIEKVTMEDRDEFGVTFGLLVTGVSKDEAAEKAGIKKYDIIQYFNGEKMHRSSDLIEAVRNCKPGSQAKIKLVRDKKEMEITATLGEAKEKDFGFNWKDKDGKEFKKFMFKSTRGFLGVQLQELSKDLAEYFGAKENGGALILKVNPDSPAAKAGLKDGDVIVKLAGKDIASPGNVTETLNDFKKGDKVDIEIMRHQKKQTINAELGETSAFPGIKVLKGIGEGDNFHISVPEFHYQGPNDEDIEIMIKEKVEKNMENAHKKMEDVQKKMEENKEKYEKIIQQKLKEVEKIKKLKEIDEYIYI